MLRANITVICQLMRAIQKCFKTVWVFSCFKLCYSWDFLVLFWFKSFTLLSPIFTSSNIMIWNYNYLILEYGSIHLPFNRRCVLYKTFLLFIIKHSKLVAHMEYYYQILMKNQKVLNITHLMDDPSIENRLIWPMKLSWLTLEAKKFSNFENKLIIL